MTWYKKALKENKKEIISSAVFILLLGITVSVWHYFTGQGFEWQEINPIEAPDIFSRLFYSALVYVTLGALLYAAGFYKFLYSLYRGTRGGWRAYNEMKGLIWLVLMLGMYFVIVPFVVDLLNSILSFFYNVFNLILYVFPSLVISGLLFAGCYYIFRKHYAIQKSA